MSIEAQSEVSPTSQFETNSTSNMSHKPTVVPAIARCSEAWRRVYTTKLAKRVNKFEAAHAAAEAYRQTMPPLVAYSNIRDFIACVGNAMLLRIIVEPDSTRLLYAAQVALSSARLMPKTAEPAPESGTTTPR